MDSSRMHASAQSALAYDEKIGHLEISPFAVPYFQRTKWRKIDPSIIESTNMIYLCADHWADQLHLIAISQN